VTREKDMPEKFWDSVDQIPVCVDGPVKPGQLMAMGADGIARPVTLSPKVTFSGLELLSAAPKSLPGAKFTAKVSQGAEMAIFQGVPIIASLDLAPFAVVDGETAPITPAALAEFPYATIDKSVYLAWKSEIRGEPFTPEKAQAAMEKILRRLDAGEFRRTTDDGEQV
jgi:hypothetical protein